VVGDQVLHVRETGALAPCARHVARPERDPGESARDRGCALLGERGGAQGSRTEHQIVAHALPPVGLAVHARFSHGLDSGRKQRVEERVRIDLKDGIADVRLVRADKLNAVDLPMFVALVEAGKALSRDGSVRAVVLSGRGARVLGRHRPHLDHGRW
jgi:hypothetical protein